MKTTTKLWIGLGILAVASPAGLLLPDALKAGAAWGEWSAEEIKRQVGYLPDGLEKLSSVWKAVMPDYAFNGWENEAFGHLSIAYIISAIVGVALCAGAAFILGKILMQKEKHRAQKNQRLS